MVMEKSFDAIDILLIGLISFYLLILVIIILWLILSKLEKYEIKTKGSSKLSSNTKFDKIINSEPSRPIKKTNPASKAVVKKKKPTVKKKTNTVKKKSNVTKNNSSRRNNGYVSPTKRKKNNRKKKS